MKFRIIFACVSLLLLTNCGHRQTKSASAETDNDALTDSATLIQPEFAKGFTVKYLNAGIRLVDICDPQKDEETDEATSMGKHKKHDKESMGRGEKMQKTYHFALIPRGMKNFNVPEGYVAVEVPIQRTICMTTPQLSNFIAMQALDFVKGISSTKNLYNKDVKQRVNDGRIVSAHVTSAHLLVFAPAVVRLRSRSWKVKTRPSFER